MRARRAVVALLTVGITAGGAVPALAHTELVSSGPKRGAVVKHLPRTIVLNFNEAIHRVNSGRVLLRGRNRVAWTRLNRTNASQIRIWTKGDAVGRYTVTVKLTSADGHRERIRFRFRVRR